MDSGLNLKQNECGNFYTVRFLLKMAVILVAQRHILHEIVISKWYGEP